jgi:hypothetical protein
MNEVSTRTSSNPGKLVTHADPPIHRIPSRTQLVEWPPIIPRGAA